MNPDISIWLKPERSQLNELQKTVSLLSHAYGANPFAPHITIYHLGNALNVPDVILKTQEVIRNAKKFSIRTVGLKYSDEFTKTLYIQLEKSEELKALHDKFKLKFTSICGYELNPHLSLIYKNNLSEMEKEKAIRKIKYPPVLNICSISIITKSGSSISTEKDVLEWKEAYEVSLL